MSNWNYSGAFILLAGSFYYAMASFYTLLAHRQFSALLAAFGSFVAVGLFFYLDFDLAWGLQNKDARIWAVIPLACAAPAYLLSGYFIKQYATKQMRIRHDKASTSVTVSTKDRITGASLLVVGLCIWAFGILCPISEKRFQIVALFVELGALINGISYLNTGHSAFGRTRAKK